LVLGCFLVCVPHDPDDLANCLMGGGKVVPALRLHPRSNGAAWFYSVCFGADDDAVDYRRAAQFKAHQIEPLRGSIADRKVVEEHIPPLPTYWWRPQLLINPSDKFGATASSAQQPSDILRVTFRFCARADFSASRARFAGHRSAPERQDGGVGRIDDQIDLAFERFISRSLFVEVAVHVVSFAKAGQEMTKKHLGDVTVYAPARQQ
jgi:hypothetical protein